MNITGWIWVFSSNQKLNMVKNTMESLHGNQICFFFPELVNSVPCNTDTIPVSNPPLPWALSYYYNMTLSMKAALPLAERLVTASDRCSKTGAWGIRGRLQKETLFIPVT